MTGTKMRHNPTYRLRSVTIEFFFELRWPFATWTYEWHCTCGIGSQQWAHDRDEARLAAIADMMGHAENNKGR